MSYHNLPTKGNNLHNAIKKILDIVKKKEEKIKNSLLCNYYEPNGGIQN